MTWLALRLLRPYLIVAAGVTVAATAYILYAAHVVQGQLDQAGVPHCLDPNICYPHGAAMDAVLGMEITAACIPALLGLIVGVALFAREHEEDTVAFVLTQSTSRQRWVLTKLGCTLAAGLVCSATVALTHRLVAARYTVLANDTYELLELLHLNNIGFMVTLTAFVTAFAAVLGLVTGRTLPTVILATVGWPLALAVAYVGVAALSYPLAALTGTSASTGSDSSGSIANDISLMDGVGYAASAVLGAGVIVIVLLGRRRVGR
jgi:ABC-type transport system involved in multi-copper enzyme maturation permease subunit